MDYIPPTDNQAEYENWVDGFCDASYADAPASTQMKYPEDARPVAYAPANQDYSQKTYKPMGQTLGAVESYQPVAPASGQNIRYA